MMRYLRDERGASTPFVLCFVLAMVILLVLLMTWVSAEINCIAVRNTIKNELTNVSIRISSDTYRAMREGNLAEYYRILTRDEAYRTELERLVESKITEAMPLETESYKVDDISLSFSQSGDNVEYIFTCDVEYYVSLFGDNRTVREEAIKLSGKHNFKQY